MHVEISEQLPKGEVTADEQVYWQKEPFATSWEGSLIAECLPIMSRVLSLKSSHNQGDYNNPILETTVTPGKNLRNKLLDRNTNYSKDHIYVKYCIKSNSIKLENQFLINLSLKTISKHRQKGFK